LNDPDNPWSGDGVPNSWAISPDGRWRICGYYPGGASDHGDYWIQQWDNDKQKYEFVGDLDLVGQYADGWFWVDNYTVLFNDYGEMTVIAE
jgi:hypothetical protein